MSLQSATAAIESQDFSALMSLSNNIRMFRDLARQDKSVQELLRQLTAPESRTELLQRVTRLLREQDDVRYRNRWDSALAVYVWCLAEKDSSIGRIAASHVLSSPRLWWARKVGLQVLAGAFFERPAERDASANIQTSAYATPPTSSTSDAIDALITPPPPAEVTHVAGATVVSTNTEAGEEETLTTAGGPRISTRNQGTKQ